ncbi:hypothetical protein PYCC9005_001687 [Savitreella phatthalungensis]
MVTRRRPRLGAYVVSAAGAAAAAGPPRHTACKSTQTSSSDSVLGDAWPPRELEGSKRGIILEHTVSQIDTEVIDLSEGITETHSTSSAASANDTSSADEPMQVDPVSIGVPESRSPVGKENEPPIRPGWFARPASRETSLTGDCPTTTKTIHGKLANFEPTHTDFPIPPALQVSDSNNRWFTSADYPTPTGGPPTVIYVSNERQLDACLARLRGPVLGYDQEWVTGVLEDGGRVRKSVSVVQVCDASTILLIHLCRFPGAVCGDTPYTAEAVLPLALKRLLEDPGLLKVGVAIMSADMARIRDVYRGCMPRGVCELSYFSRLVDGGGSAPVRGSGLISLAALTLKYLGRPLSKGPVRTSDWENFPLTREQRQYAADDAYAGYLIFIELERRRRKACGVGGRLEGMWPRVRDCPPPPPKSFAATHRTYHTQRPPPPTESPPRTIDIHTLIRAAAAARRDPGAVSGGRCMPWDRVGDRVLKAVTPNTVGGDVQRRHLARLGRL